MFYSGSPLKLLNNQFFCLDCIFSQVEAFSLALQACLRLTYSSTVILCRQIRLVQYHNFALSEAILMVTNSTFRVSALTRNIKLGLKVVQKQALWIILQEISDKGKSVFALAPERASLDVVDPSPGISRTAQLRDSLLNRKVD